MSDCEGCDERWRVEAADLRTGIVKAVLQPIAMDFERILNGFGSGTLTLATKDVLIRDIWPHATSIHIIRLTGDTPAAEWVGYVEKVTASDGGTTSVGMHVIENYLNRRVLRQSLPFPPNTDQREIGAAIVNMSEPYLPGFGGYLTELDGIDGGATGNGGIPMFGLAEEGGFPVNRTISYNAWDRKNLGGALTELSDTAGGPDWIATYHMPGEAPFNPAGWSTLITVANRVGVSRDEIILKSDRDANGYSLDVDAANHATFVDGVGSGQEEAMLIAEAVDDSPLYPQFDAVPAWKDVEEPVLLQDLTDGYLEDNRDPIALPSVTVPGHDRSSQDLRLGDEISLDVSFGAVTYKGRARILGIAWGVSDGEPDSRTFTLYPITRASEAVLFQQDTGDDCEEC